MATTTTTVTTPDGTTTTTTTDAPTSDYTWDNPCYRRTYDRFVRSRVCRELRRFVALSRELQDLAADLAERMPASEVLNDYSDDLGPTMAEDVQSAIWGLRIATDLVDSELPYRRPRARPATKKKAERKAATGTPAAIPVVGVLDARTEEERLADEAAGKSWDDVCAEVLAGTAEKLTPKPTLRIPKVVADRMGNRTN